MLNKEGKNKYTALFEMLKKNILDGEILPGEPLPSENELAQTYGISRNTVRKALAMLEKDGYVEARHGSGTYCSDKMRHLKQSKEIAVIIPYMSGYIYSDIIHGIESVFNSNNYKVICKNTGNLRQKESKCLEEILSMDIDGVLIEPSKSQIYSKDLSLYQKLDKYDIPYVFINGFCRQIKDKPYIVMDDYRGGYLVTDHLLELGHKNIIGIFKVDDNQGINRYRGYVKAIQDRGMIFEPGRVIWFHTEDRTFKPAQDVKMLIEEGVEIDGIVCYNDQIAWEIIRTLQEMKISVPDDISITGYDDSDISQEENQNLTTIIHPKEKFGEMAARLLLEKIQGIPDCESKIPRVIEAELIIRKSCMDRMKK